jgi:(1->4)-alpha-D-glucan 1-alpha-D-glucosylmutase
MNEVLGLQVDPEGLHRLEVLGREATGDTEAYPELLRAAKAQVLEELFAGELQVLSERVAGLLSIEQDVAQAALHELLLAFPVYRTYGGDAWRAADARILTHAFAQARETAGPAARAALEQLEHLLGSPLNPEARTFLLGFQQLSGPLMAKSAEDTAFYRYARLLALNEVGGEPDARGLEPEAFHRLAAHRLERWPGSMLATATHDTKRGEDARARLAVLSELPDAWAQTVRHWRRLNAAHRGGSPAIHPKDEYTLYQTLVGVWPPDLAADDRPAVAHLRERLETWQQKALREGKERSSWNAPDQAYEDAARGFLGAILDHDRAREFLASLTAFVHLVAPAGVANSLGQTLLKLTAPGVPDIYQGTELWDESLVDPDNRRPIDFAAREHLLGIEGRAESFARDWRDGAVKLRLLATGLAVRARSPELFARGRYEPLTVAGAHARHVLAFARSHEGEVAIVIVGRRLARLIGDSGHPAPAAHAWGDTAVVLPPTWRGLHLTDELHGTHPAPEDGRLPLAGLLTPLPVSLLSGRR